MNYRNIIENALGGIISAAVIALAVVIFTFMKQLEVRDYILISTNLVLLFAHLLYKRKLESITGIGRVDPSIEEGITPNESLGRCKNNFRFLGIAANKIVNCKNFNASIKRCHKAGEPIRFLLSSPDNPLLALMATRAGKEKSAFVEMIKTSLRELKKFKEGSGYNIEVCLYKSVDDCGPPVFRLFFIDNKSVLVSYYRMGEGDGLQMPQLLINKHENESEVKNFYFAFNQYFNSLWANSEQWDFEKYVNDA
jgi:hypothetical protein